MIGKIRFDPNDDDVDLMDTKDCNTGSVFLTNTFVSSTISSIKLPVRIILNWRI